MTPKMQVPLLDLRRYDSDYETEAMAKPNSPQGSKSTNLGPLGSARRLHRQGVGRAPPAVFHCPRCSSTSTEKRRA